MMTARTILLDVGGSYIKSPDAAPVPIKSAGTEEDIAMALRNAIGDIGEVERIGIAIPGPFDFKEGIFLMKHKFAAVYGRSFRALAGVPESVPIRYMHDVNAALQGAVTILGLKGNTALVTLGTGLGFSYTINGEVQTSPMGSPERSIYNLPCGDGILEDKISGKGIRGFYAEKTGETGINAHAIAQLANAGNDAALEAYSDVGTLLGEVLADILPDLGVTTLLMGGQISKSLSLMQRPLANALDGIAVLPCPEGAVFEGLRSLFSNNQPI